MMAKTLATIFSYILHPLLMPVYGLFFIFNSRIYAVMLNIEAILYIYLVTFVFTFVFPLIFIPFFIYWKKISNIHMNDKSERHYPLAMSIIFYGICFYLLQNLPIPKIIIAYILASLVTLIVDFILTLKWKVSLHLSGTGGILAMLIVVSIIYHVNLILFIIITLFAAGLLGSSRMKLLAHKPFELIAGFFAGFCSVIATMIIYFFIQ